MKILITAASKGGVGKSLISINIAYALKKLGYKAGLLDSDISMPAVVKYLKLENEELQTHQLVEPVEHNGVQILSAGLMMDKDQPVLIDSDKREALVGQFIDKTAWNVDFLVIDTPPGATDELAYVTKQRKNDLKGIFVVSTPSSIAVSQVRRSIELFRRMHSPMLGIIGNMTGFECEKCHYMNDMFKNGAENPLEELAKNFKLKLLASIPMYAGVDDDPLHFVDYLIAGLHSVGF